MYTNALPLSKLFGLALLLSGLAGLLIWGICLTDMEGSTAFDTGSLILLGLSAGLFLLSVLVLRHARGIRIIISILLHLAALALLAMLPFVVPALEATTDKVVSVILILLGVGLAFLAILALHSDALKADFAVLQAQVRRRRRRWYLLAAACLLLLVIALAAWQIVPLLVARPTITVDYLALANQASKPVEYDPNRNAARYYEMLFSQFTPLPEALKDKHKTWPTDLDPDEKKALEEWAPVNESALSALAQAVRCPYWWRELKSSDGAMSNVEVPDLDRIRDCARGVLLLATYRATQGDADRAVQMLLDLHGFGAHQTQGATLVEQLAGAAICGMSYDTLLVALDRCKIEKDALKSALDTLAGRVPQIIVPRFSEVEHLYGQDSIQRAFTDDGPGRGRLIPAQLCRIEQKRADVRGQPLSYLDAVRICLTHPSRQETFLLGEAYFAYVKESAGQTPWDLHVRNTSYEQQLGLLLSRNFFLQDNRAGMDRCIRVGWRNRVTGEATVAILAILTYKTQEGRLPPSLKELTDKGLLSSVPMDPYSGAPLVYRVHGDDFALYSVGEDFVDNGGRPCEWNDQTGGDHVFWPVSEESLLKSLLRRL
jgi:hypothetical protein